MPRVSKTPISPELENKIKKAFPTLLASLKSKSDINSFNTSLLSLEEQEMFGKRILLYAMIYKNYPVERIRSLLGISTETIRFHKNNWIRLDPKTKNLIRRLATNLL